VIRVFPLALAAGTVLAAGLAHGLATDRWSLSNEPAASAARLADVPVDLGPCWHMGEQEELDKQVLVIADIAGYLNRTVRNHCTGDQLRMLLVCGRWGPISVHPPEVCYGGAGFELLEQQKRTLSVGLKAPAQFSYGQFHKRGAAAGDLQIFWAWSSDGTWIAEPPRWRFPHGQRLFKLYIIRPMTSDDPEGRVAMDFIKTLLPELQEHVFSEPQ
jgi:hypothetical protein